MTRRSHVRGNKEKRYTFLNIINTMPKMNRNQIPTNLLPPQILITLRDRFAPISRSADPAGAQNIPNPTILDDLLDLRNDRRLPSLQPHHSKLHTTLVLESQQFPCFSGAFPQWPLDEDVLPGFQTRGDGWEMSVHSNAADYKVDIFIVGEFCLLLVTCWMGWGGGGYTLRIPVCLDGRGEVVESDCFGGGFGGAVAESYNFVVWGCYEVWEMGFRCPS